MRPQILSITLIRMGMRFLLFYLFLEGNPTGGWKGAVPCDATQGQVMGAACLDLWGNGVGGSLSLVPSGMGGTERTERFLFRPTPGGASQLLRRYLYDG